MKKNILMISSYFPPAGGVGVLRFTKYCKYLARAGYNPFVLTPPFWSVKRDRDNSMLADVPKSAELIQPGFIDLRRLVPGEIAKHLRNWEREHLFPDNIIQWVKVVQKLLPNLLREKQIDIVFITLPHFSLLALAETVKACSKVPVILDMRDPFSFNFYNQSIPPSAYKDRILALERSAFRASDKIIMVTQYNTQKYKQLYPEVADRCFYIPNGYDNDDFPGHISDVNTLPNEHLTVCYTGSYSSMSSIFPYRDAIANIYTKHKIRIILKLPSPIKAKRVYHDFKSLKRLKLLDYKGFMSHKEAIGQLLNSHVLLLPILPPHVVPFKIYEYFRANRIVLCAVDSFNESHELLQPSGLGVFTELKETEALENELLRLHNLWKDKCLAVSPNWDYIHQFGAEQRCEKLIKLIESI